MEVCIYDATSVVTFSRCELKQYMRATKTEVLNERDEETTNRGVTTVLSGTEKGMGIC
jgi:hypothetical protein